VTSGSCSTAAVLLLRASKHPAKENDLVSQDGDDGGMYYILQILQRFYQFYTQILIL